MKRKTITVTTDITKCTECPYLKYSMDGTVCSKLPLIKAFVLPEGKETIPDRCPYLK
jgi:hypothetical protein